GLIGTPAKPPSEVLMIKRVPVSFWTSAGATATALGVLASLALAAAPALAQEPPPPPAPEAAPVTPPAVVAQPLPAVASVSPTTDHDSIVGHWGVEARQVAVFQRTLLQESGCETSCPQAVNLLGVRHWSKERYAWTAGLALATGGGSSRRDGST